MLVTLEVMTLLKNDNDLLPLESGKRTIAVIGPHAKAQGALVGNYLGQICPFSDGQDCVVTPLEVWRSWH
jgi:beta-glucosidase-like glycosyl hydrolase